MANPSSYYRKWLRRATGDTLATASKWALGVALMLAVLGVLAYWLWERVHDMSIDVTGLIVAAGVPPALVGAGLFAGHLALAPGRLDREVRGEFGTELAERDRELSRIQDERDRVLGELAETRIVSPSVDYRLTASADASSRPWATAQELAATHVVDRRFRIADIPQEAGFVRGRTFERCLLEGPCIVGLIGHVRFEGLNTITSGSSAELEQTLWEVPERAVVVGLIALDNCVFMNSEFRNVGFAGTKDSLDVLRQADRERRGEGSR